MTQAAFDFPLTEFEQATLEAQVSFKAATDKDIDRLMGCAKLKAEVKGMVHKWTSNRVKLGLIPFR